MIIPTTAAIDGIPVPTNTWPEQVKAPASVQEACRMGVQGEIENAAMYQRLLQLTQAYPDVQNVFLNLQRASQTRHLPAFQRCDAREQTQIPQGGGWRRGYGRGCRQRA